MDYKKVNRGAYAPKGMPYQNRYNGSVSAQTVLNYANTASKPEKPLAMMYAPYQYFEELYCAEKGFLAGTIFMQLDLPCTACTSCCVRR